MESLTLLKAIQKYLMLPNEGTAEFAKQYRALNEQDKDDLRRYFPESGLCNITSA